ncbi:MAG: 16S rRNA (cytidine(1402)-2'-O)-methyltransferase [Calditrichaceae bacterium]
MEEIQTGVLYVVATPIGNLNDFTYRARFILSHVDVIAAEDTRTTGVLLRHYDIKTQLRSYHSYNLKSETPRLINLLSQGKTIALVSDAGTPGISDPGYQLVQACIEEDIKVIPIPGASALTAALPVSGLPINRFVFEGFLPLKKGRKTRLEFLSDEERTVVLYESPHRIQRTVKDLMEFFGDRRCVMAREITKKFEEIFRGKLSDLKTRLEEKKIKGEIVLLIAGKSF